MKYFLKYFRFTSTEMGQETFSREQTAVLRAGSQKHQPLHQYS